MHTISNAIIDRLGGTHAVAQLCQVSDSAVTQWRTNGIPHARLMFLELARPKVFRDLPCGAKGDPIAIRICPDVSIAGAAE